MATDFFHTREIIDAVIDVLKGADGTSHTGGLPAAWFPDAADGSETRLVRLEHGDYADYPLDGLAELCPAILVRGLGPRPAGRGGTGGVLESEETVRVVHLRRFDQCRDDTGAVERNMSRARGRYAKLINRALFNDPQKRLATIASSGDRTEATLACADAGGAQIVSALWAGWDLGHDGPAGSGDVARIRAVGDSARVHALGSVTKLGSLGEPARLWAIACDVNVRVRTG